MQFWKTIEAISKKFEVVSCSEPILSLVWNGKTRGSSCGNSIRIHPDGNISSCVYVPNNENIEKFNVDKKVLPDFCNGCKISEKCVGGCYGRRIMENRQTEPDFYCPFYNKKELPKIKFKKYKEGKDFIHGDYLCTIILR